MFINHVYFLISFSLKQELANCSPWVKSGPQSVFVNRILLGHSLSLSFTCCLWLLLCLSAGLGSCDRSSLVCKAFNIYHLDLYKKVFPALLLRIDACIVSILFPLPQIFNTSPTCLELIFSWHLFVVREIYLDFRTVNKQDTGTSLDCFC